MRATTAYFAGVGTVAVAIAAGLGGGLLLGDIMSPQQPKHRSSEVTRLEQRSSQQPIPAKNGASQPVPHLATPQVNAAVAVPQAPPPQQQETQPRQAQHVRQASTQPAAAEQPATRERAVSENSLAKASDGELKRDARRAKDRRKAERRQQWAEKRRVRSRQQDDLSDVEASVREVTESRPPFGRDESRPLIVR